MATEKIKAKGTPIKGLYEVEAMKLFSVFTTEELKIATDQCLDGNRYGLKPDWRIGLKTVILSKKEIEVLTEIWKQRCEK